MLCESCDLSHIICFIFKLFGDMRISTNNYTAITSTLPSYQLVSTNPINLEIQTYISSIYTSIINITKSNKEIENWTTKPIEMSHINAENYKVLSQLGTTEVAQTFRAGVLM